MIGRVGQVVPAKPLRDMGRLPLLFILHFGVLVAVSSAIRAEDPSDLPNSGIRTEDLVRRLEQAEERIRLLEEQSKPSASLLPTLLFDEPAPQSAARPMQFSQPHLVGPIPETASFGTAIDSTLRDSTARRGSALVKVGGLIHIDGTLFPTASPGIGYFENPSTGEDPENRLEFRRLRLELSGDIHEDMFYSLQIDFSDPNEPQVLDAYLGFNDVPCFQSILVGNQLRPLGLDVLTSGRCTVFMENALVFGESNVDSRRIGILSQGYSPDESVNWQFGVFEVPNLQSTGLYLSDPLELSVNARCSGTPWYDACSGGRNYLHLGASTALANANGDVILQSRPELRTQSRWIDTGEITDSDWWDSTGFEGLLNLGSWSIGGEWVETLVHRSEARSALFFHGGYLYVAYFLTGDYQPIDRKLGVLTNVTPLRNFVPARVSCGDWGAWQVAVRVSYFDLSDEDVLGGDEINFTLGVNWWFNPHSRLMFNYVVGNIDNHEPVGGYRGGHFSGLAMRIQVDF